MSLSVAPEIPSSPKIVHSTKTCTSMLMSEDPDWGPGAKTLCKSAGPFKTACLFKAPLQGPSSMRVSICLTFSYCRCQQGLSCLATICTVHESKSVRCDSQRVHIFAFNHAVYVFLEVADGFLFGQRDNL